MSVNPFRFPLETHTRTQTPAPFGDYRRYKPFLRIEFSRQCVYCRMPDGIKGEHSFGVDHYRPRRRFPDLSCAYSNLFYSCNPCNSRKGDTWFDGEELARGLFIPNPCDHRMADHLTYRGARVEARTPAGRLAVDVLLLDDEDDVRYREFVLRSIERCLVQAEAILGTIVELRRLLSKAAEPERREMQRDLDSLGVDLAAIQDDLERLTGARLVASDQGGAASGA